MNISVRIICGAILMQYVGRPAYSPNGPFVFVSRYMQWNIFLYSKLPLASGFYFCSFVFALSKGRDAVAAQLPARKLARNQARLLLFGIITDMRSFASSYVTNIARLRAIARTIVGTPPFQRPLTPSSTGIRLNALKTEV